MHADEAYLAYRDGIFPMADGAHAHDPIRWYYPEFRAVFIPCDFHLPRRLKRWLRHSGFAVRWQDDFESVMRACAENRKGGTWINEPMIALFTELAASGRAYCLSVFQEGKRVGGIYGVCMGGVLTAESMFSRAPNASSAALAVLMRAACDAGIGLVDIQLPNDHTRRFKPTIIPHDAYMAVLHRLRDSRVVIKDMDVYSAAGVLLSTQSFSQTS